MATVPAAPIGSRTIAGAGRSRRQNLAMVVFWMTGTLLCFSAMAVGVRELAGTLNTFEILSLRSSTGLVILLALVVARPGLRSDLALRHMGLHFVRNTVHFAAQYGWVLSLTLLPLATVFALEFTMPMWVALLAIPVLGERMTVSRAGSIVLGFLGVLVILRPGMESFKPAALLVLACAVGYAVAVTSTKKLTRVVSTFGILFWMNVIQLPLALSGSDPAFPLRLGAHQVLPVLAVALTGIASHFCLTNAFRSGDAIMVVPLDFLRIPLIAVVGWAFYNEALDVFVFAGAGLIISGVLWNLAAEFRRPAVSPAAQAGARLEPAP